MPKKIAIDQLITFKTSLLSQLLSRLVDTRVADDMNLNSRQWRTLVCLYQLGPSTASDIVKFSEMDKSQVSRAVSDNEQRGLLAQSVDTNDRRRVVIELTATGKAVLKAGMGGIRQRQEALESCLSQEDREAFHRIMDALSTQAKSMLSEQERKQSR